MPGYRPEVLAIAPSILPGIADSISTRILLLRRSHGDQELDNHLARRRDDVTGSGTEIPAPASRTGHGRDDLACSGVTYLGAFATDSNFKIGRQPLSRLAPVSSHAIDFAVRARGFDGGAASSFARPRTFFAGEGASLGASTAIAACASVAAAALLPRVARGRRPPSVTAAGAMGAATAAFRARGRRAVGAGGAISAGAATGSATGGAASTGGSTGRRCPRPIAFAAADRRLE